MIVNFIDPMIIIILLSIGYSIFPSAINASIAIIIHRKHLGIAYGLITALFNAILTIYPIIIGKIIETDKNSNSIKNSKHIDIDIESEINGYKNAELVFISINILSIIFGILLFIDDKYYTGKYKLIGKKRKHSDCDHQKKTKST